MLTRLRLILIPFPLVLAGCALAPSDAPRTAAGLALGAAGGWAGSAASQGEPAAAAAGAALGALSVPLLLGRDPAAREEGFAAGYVQGQSDAIKRQYWLQQAVHRRSPEDEARAFWYVLPGPTETSDGRRLEPHTVAIRIVE